MSLSINGRMLIAATIMLVAFLGVTALILDRSFRSSIEDALKNRLQVQLSVLIASMEQHEESQLFQLSHRLPESDFLNFGTPLYAMILDYRGKPVWSSVSIQGLDLPLNGGLARGEKRFERLSVADGRSFMVYRLGLTWGEERAATEGYTFVVAESLQHIYEQVSTFRTELWILLGSLTAGLLVMLTFILRWGLAPLRHVAHDLGAIESGRHPGLRDHYPKELLGLTSKLNDLIRTNREHEARYSASLGDLAHSLKTPLAILRGAVEVPHPTLSLLRSSVEEQVARMDQIVKYQLQRAAASGRTALMVPVVLERVVEKVVNAMTKVYMEKGVRCDVDIESGMEFHGSEGDLMELLGNLVDNAFKWCEQRVDIKIYCELSDDKQGKVLCIEVSDDGPGIPQGEIDTVLQRGGRADYKTSGHGLGLAMVQDIVALYYGGLGVGRSELGGALIRVWFPVE